MKGLNRESQKGAKARKGIPKREIRLINELHKSHERLMDLLDALKETLPGLPGFRSLSLFGSMAEGRADGYSDIDAIVTTNDLPEAKARLLGVIEQIGPIECCWVINLRPDEWNPTIVLKEENYYHKLDLGLVDSSAADRTIPADQTVLLVEKPQTPTRTAGESRAYVPEHGSMGHFLLGQFLGSTRYLKARKRGQAMTCYRFAAAAVDWHLALRYARLTDDPHLRSKLSTVAYRELDSLLGPEDGATVLSKLDLSTTPAMDLTLRSAMGSMLEDGRFLAAMSDEALPADVFERMSRFLAEELSSP